MSILRLASEQTKRIDLSDDGDWVEVRADISKRTFNSILSRMPNVETGKEITIEQGIDFQKMLFEVFVTGWSLDVPASLENYEALARDAGEAIDTVLAQHFESLTPTRDESTKSA